jgi:hypothetical protein
LETALVVVFLSCVIADRGFGLRIGPKSEGGEIVLGGLFMVVCLFLLVASPFFFRSLGWVAWAGWIVAVGLFIWGLLTPIS